MRSKYFFKKKKKAFKHYPNLPPELRMMIVDEMKAEERGRFSGCSKLSNKEAKLSKNYMYAVSFWIKENDITLNIAYGADENDYDGYRFTYVKENGKKYVKTTNLSSKKLGISRLDKSTSLVKFAVQHFKNVMNMYQSDIKVLQIALMTSKFQLSHANFGIENLKNLVELSLFNVSDVQQFLSKIRKDLTKIEVFKNLDNKITECEQIYRVRGNLSLPYTRFTYEQFMKICAQEVYILIGGLQEKNIFDFIKSWENGTRDVKEYKWILTNSNFDVKKLFDLFGAKYNRVEAEQVHIIYNEEDGKTGILTHFASELVFRTIETK